MYTHLTLIGLGLLGVVLHTLVELYKLNKASEGNMNYKKYFAVEWIAIIISVGVVFALTFLSQEITDLANAGKWIGLGTFAIGYLGQSVLITFMGKAQKVVDQKIES